MSFSLPYRLAKFPREIRWSLRILLVMFIVAILGKFIANDVPIIGSKDGKITIPVVKDIAHGLGLMEWKDRHRFNHLENEYDFSIKPLVPYSSHYMDHKNAGYVSPFAQQQIKSLYYRHWLGTDELGRDVTAGLIRGTWIAFVVAFFSVAIALIIGIPIGLTAGYFGNKNWKLTRAGMVMAVLSLLFFIYYSAYFIDSFFHFLIVIVFLVVFNLVINKLLARFMPHLDHVSVPLDSLFNKSIEVFKSIPNLIILFLFLGVFAKTGIRSIVIVIGLIAWVRIARYIRAETLAIRENDYIKSLKAMGSSDWNIMIKNILPIAFPPVMVSVIFLADTVILMEATLSFFGIGLSVEEVSWGGMLNEARKFFGAWWLAVFPGAALFMVIVAFANVGQYLTKQLNPKLQD